MKLKYLFIVAVLASWMVSCNKDEDEVTPNVKDTSFYFAPNDTCTDEESQMRRDFFDAHGSYLLFNDTIQHYFTSVDINGDSVYFTEKLDLSYSVGDVNTNNTTYTFTLLTNLQRKKEAVEFMEENILYHFTNDLQPFSWLLCNKITYTYINTVTNPVAASGQRAIAISMYNLPRIRTEAQKTNYIQQILLTIVNKVVTERTKLFSDFSAISATQYSSTFTGYDDKSSSDCLKYLYSQGFLSRGKSAWGNVANGYYPTAATDMSDFARLVVINSYEDIQTKYADYPTILKKAKLMIDDLKSIGYVFEKEEEE